MQNMQETPSFDRLLGKISSQLMRASTHRIDTAIRHSVEAIGKYYGVDRVDVRRFNEDCSETTLLSGWTSGKDTGPATDLQKDEIRWASSMILRGQEVRIGSLDDMPPGPAGTGRHLMQEEGLAAALIVPVNLDEKLFGAVVLAVKTEHDWTDRVVTEVKSLGELIAIAHSRAKLLSKVWTIKGIFNLDGDRTKLQPIGWEATDRRAAENALRQSERRHRDLVENISDWIWEIDLDWNIVYSNANVEALLGYTVEEVQRLSASDLLHPDVFRDGLALLKSQFANPVGWEQVLVRFHHKDGGYRISQSNARPKLDDEGNLVGFRGIDRDVTEAVRSQEEILRHSEFQRQLAELSTKLLTAPIESTTELVNEEFRHICKRYGLFSGGIWTVGEDDHNSVERRAGWRDTTKVSRAETDRYPRDVVPWFASHMLNDQVIRVNSLDEAPEEGKRDRDAFQTIGIEALLGFPALATSGLRGYCAFASDQPREWDDVTVQELNLIASTLTAVCARVWAAEDILRSQQDLIRSQAVASLGSYSIEFDPPADEFLMNINIERSPQHLRLHGVSDERETTGQLLERIHPDDYERAIAVMRDGFGTEQGVRQTYRLVRPDKTMIHIESRIEFDTDEHGRVTRAFGIDYDVTERVQAQQELETALAEIGKLRDQLQQENTFLRDEIRVAHGFDKIVGSGPKLKQAQMLAEKVAPTGVSVLILGETGTGKELIAQSIHDMSDRKNKAMISVNCAALSRDLIESELFGHEKGAFTGAHERRKGRFELADGGTLFLDEIGELSADLQAKLLRVLQSGEVVRLGGTETLTVDVRIVAATNKNLRRAVDEGEFRPDLFYRIGTFPIELPPLRERREDIPALIEFLVEKHAERMGKDIHSISDRTIRHLSQQQWPGNVRELESILQRALISTPGPTLDYVEPIDSISITTNSTTATPATTDLLEVQRQHIVSMLNVSNWVIDGKNGAAAKMGVAASTLRSKMKRLDIQRPV